MISGSFSAKHTTHLQVFVRSLLSPFLSFWRDQCHFMVTQLHTCYSFSTITVFQSSVFDLLYSSVSGRFTLGLCTSLSISSTCALFFFTSALGAGNSTRRHIHFLTLHPTTTWSFPGHHITQPLHMMTLLFDDIEPQCSIFSLKKNAFYRTQIQINDQ